MTVWHSSNSRNAPNEKYDPRPKTEDELLGLIRQELTAPLDYNTSVDAMWKVTLAAFNYAAHVVGASGFQASCADLAFVGHTRGYKGPFALIDSNDLLYPQYDIEKTTFNLTQKWLHTWANKEARKRLEEFKAKPFIYSNDPKEPPISRVHPNVVAHWEWLASLPDWKEED